MLSVFKKISIITTPLLFTFLESLFTVVSHFSFCYDNHNTTDLSKTTAV